MDGAGIALIIFGSIVLLILVAICNYMVEKGAADGDAAAVASSDPRRGAKDGGVEVVVDAGKVDSVTVGCCCGGGDGSGSGGDGGGCGGGCGGD
ncbi:hypothetical protein CDL15_Pgr000626 [Punica granatum]|uniref:Uncharacterized protein n=1 Tax=Punica granatum TaxID=22663 RepID=A0A218W2T3_PUNGR|nr:hypothetical protein CDL15_Pgr000626 [Punica granatum]PKI72226.1 hypothetical protein CRG98_007424 [Punica granatum]